MGIEFLNSFKNAMFIIGDLMSINPGTEADIDILNQLIIEFNLQQLPFPENPPWKTLSFVFDILPALKGRGGCQRGNGGKQA